METGIIVAIAGVAVSATGFFVFHFLASRRERAARRAAACKEFRERLGQAMASVPPADKHWDNGVLSQIPRVVVDISVGIEALLPFLPMSEQQRMKVLRNEMSSIAQEIPKAQAPESILYGGGQTASTKAKATFHSKVEGMKAMASHV